MPLPLGLGVVFGGLTAALSRLIFSKAGAWIAAAAVFLGLELVTYSFAIEPLRDAALQAFNGLPAAITQWMGVLRLDQYVTIVLSAYAASVVKKTLLRRRAA